MPPRHSDVSHTPSPVQRATPSSAMKRARESSHFSPEEIQMFEEAFEASASVPPAQEAVRPVVRGFSSKLHPYDGTSESFETFIARFENFSTHFQWTEAERLFHLRNSLAKSIGNVLWDSGSPSTSSELLTLLRSHYGTEFQTNRFRMELKTRRRQKDESL